MIFEICTDSIEGARAAEKYGAKRIELCSALSVGGLTPSLGLAKQCVENSTIEVHAMIRHKEGGFNYSNEDIKIMKTDINAVKGVGCHGVVFGVLNENTTISNLNRELFEYSKTLGLEVTFHRAFDFVSDYKIAIEQLIDIGFDRLLTSGLRPKAEQGLDVIEYLQSNYGNQIQIMAGSGINSKNALKMASSGINNLHFTAQKQSNISANLSMGEVMIVDEEKIKNITNLFT